MFCVPGLIFGGTVRVGSLFHAPGLIFIGSEGLKSRFYVLHASTRVRLYRGRRLPFSCFTLPDSVSAITRASAPVFMFRPPGLIFVGKEGVGS
jgi:hypothetical protein